MKTGLKKHQKITEIWFDEGEPVIHVHTYNTDLRNRICAKAKQYPEDFLITDYEEDGSIRADIAKGRLSFRLTEPYPSERKQKMSADAKKQYRARKGITKK